MDKYCNKVFVTSGEGPFANAENACSKLPLSCIKDKSILIKPNIGRVSSPENGINTHPKAIAGVITALQKFAPSRIAIGESPIAGVKTMDAFKKAGITEIAERYKCELIDLDAKEPVVKNIKSGRVISSTKICADIFNFDFILSLPVAKTHMHTGVTLGIKNMKGCLYKKEKVRYHQLEYIEGHEFKEKTLDSAISDLATILLPSITVIDGYIGMEGLGPSGGDAVKSNFSVASINPFAADVICCEMMGINPSDIPHLKIISERLDFSINPMHYDVNPSDYKKHSVIYKKPPKQISIEYPDVLLTDKESCSACLSTAMFFLKRFKKDMNPYRLSDGKLHLAIGAGVEENDIKEGSIIIGNCAKKVKCKGVFIPGCPPVPTRIYKELTGREPEENEPEIK